jgi:hypothetical protein
MSNLFDRRKRYSCKETVLCPLNTNTCSICAAPRTCTNSSPSMIGTSSTHTYSTISIPTTVYTVATSSPIHVCMYQLHHLYPLCTHSHLYVPFRTDFQLQPFCPLHTHCHLYPLCTHSITYPLAPPPHTTLTCTPSTSTCRLTRRSKKSFFDRRKNDIHRNAVASS